MILTRLFPPSLCVSLQYMEYVEEAFEAIAERIEQDVEKHGIRHVFDSFDLNGDGVLCHKEFQQSLCDKLNLHFSARELRALVGTTVQLTICFILDIRFLCLSSIGFQEL
jgi:hypothetical protein